MSGTGSEDRASIAAGILAAGGRHAELLRTIVEVARSIFGAKAASVMLFDVEASELVFEAVVGEGEETLVGTRIPSGTGIAGFVLDSAQPLVIEDVQSDPRFARDVAEDSGYVPDGLMAVPLMRGEDAIGVLSVLDRRERFSVDEMDLLALFATQAAITLDLLERSRRAQAMLADDAPGEEVGENELEDLATAIESIDDPRRRRAALGMVGSLVELLREFEGPPAIRFRK